ncbi:glycosyltransferase family 4 protein [Geothermobacter hydrogeniphilus]|uniref:Glycosyl transferase n=1 Tax=Geothermobacter hydrogeniphilus TaxID=1969733 RepID=A0A1X0XK93_9BACT|nr:glycosyltransferase family 4 protein [Geothermobacter hydrogeniphilus]ORJ53258.1 glycosyl transferase [Geothermobacter hydrogeniphilus]
MKIAQVSPLYESVPPSRYGGTERVVSFLTEELVRQGHDVTLFASADSTTSAELIPCTPRALRLGNCSDPLAQHLRMLEEIFRRVDEFDAVHFHIDYLHFPLSRRHRCNQLTTLHGRLDTPDLAPLYREYRDMPLVSISDAQRAPLPFANWLGTVHHGLPKELFRLQEQPGDYLAFLGRISPEKRPDRAIEIARRAGIPLKIAAKVDRADREYFETHIRPLLDSSLVEFIGEIGEHEKQEFLGGALALLFPIDWPEPFGLVMIEAMACGTPVIAFRHGSVPEVMVEGQSGFIVSDISSAVARVREIGSLDRHCCRQVFETRFSVEQMARNYLELYQRQGQSRHDRPQPPATDWRVETAA